MSDGGGKTADDDLEDLFAESSDEEAEEQAQVTAGKDAGRKRRREGGGRGAEKRARTGEGGSGPAADGQTAYDSGGEEEETEADRAFIDSTGDDAEMMRQYKQPQNFREDEVDVEFEGGEGGGGGAEPKEVNVVDRVTASLRRGRKKSETTEELQRRAQALIDDMSRAVEQDREAERAGEPPVAKLTMLEEVSRALRSSLTFVNVLLRMKMLRVRAGRRARGQAPLRPAAEPPRPPSPQVLKDWLQPTDGGTLCEPACARPAGVS